MVNDKTTEDRDSLLSCILGGILSATLAFLIVIAIEHNITIIAGVVMITVGVGNFTIFYGNYRLLKSLATKISANSLFIVFLFAMFVELLLIGMPATLFYYPDETILRLLIGSIFMGMYQFIFGFVVIRIVEYAIE